MSRVVAPTHDPVEIHPRRMTAKRKQAIYARQYGRCAKCRELIVIWPYDIDHIIPLALGGSDDDNNCEALCKVCHRIKTADDRKAIAKAKRLAGETGTGPKRAIQSRGFGAFKRPLKSRGFEKTRATTGNNS